MIHVLPKFKSCRLLFASLAVACATLPAVAQVAAPADRPPTLVGEATAQFQLAYRLRPAEGQHRYEQLNAVVAAWRAAPRTEANNERLSNWLRAAIRASMPGSRDALPPMPAFADGVERKKRVTEPTPTETRAPEPTPAATPVDSANLDPFRDDPVDEQETK
jgi:hypothetical protein